MTEDFGSAQERMFTEWQEQALQRVQKLQEMSTQVEQISVTESSKDESIRVTVSSNGQLRDLQIDESASKKSMSEVADEVMRTVQKALAQVPDLVRETATATVGAEDSSVDYILDEVTKNFPTEPEEPESSTAKGSAPTQAKSVEEIKVSVDDEDESTLTSEPWRGPVPPTPRTDASPWTDSTDGYDTGTDDDEEDWDDGQTFLR